MEITLVSHASVVIDAGGTKIWTDPWTVSRAFNNSWSLIGKPAYSPEMLDAVQYLWISHEHPDHFNVPTLKSLPESFRQRVIVLFQQQNSEKIFNALRQFGFRNFQSLPNGRVVQLTNGVDVYCYQASFGDSCLGVRHAGEVLFNVNDAELAASDCRRIVKALGKVDVVLNQFSLAGYNGYLQYEQVLPTLAQEKLTRLSNNHRDLNARVTVPFASFVYFSSEDNRFLNDYANSPQTVAAWMRAHEAPVRFLFLGERAALQDLVQADSDAARHSLAQWQAIYEHLDELEYSADPPVHFGDIQALAAAFSASLRQYFPALLLRRVKPLRFYIRDLDMVARFDTPSGALEATGEGRQAADILVNSQPLAAAFRFPSGFETLAVSGRFLLQQHFRNWQLLKSITILWNNQIYLRARYLLDGRLLRYLAMRIKGGLLRQMMGKARLRAAAARAANAHAAGPSSA